MGVLVTDGKAGQDEFPRQRGGDVGRRGGGVGYRAEHRARDQDAAGSGAPRGEVDRKSVV